MSTIVKMPFRNPADVAFALKNKVWDIDATGPMGYGSEKRIDKMFIYPNKPATEKYGENVKVLVATDVKGSIISEGERLKWPSNDEKRKGRLNNVRYSFDDVVELTLKEVKTLFPDVAGKSMRACPTGSYVSK